MSANTFTGIARDYQNGQSYEYPKKPENIGKVRLPYDFIFTRKGVWYYISSCGDSSLFTDKRYSLHTPVEQQGEKWKVVNSITGEIIQEN